MADKKTIYLDDVEKAFKEIDPTQDGIGAKEFNVNSTSYGMSLDGSNNLVFDDAITGSKTLAELLAGGETGIQGVTGIQGETGLTGVTGKQVFRVKLEYKVQLVF